MSFRRTARGPEGLRSRREQDASSRMPPIYGKEVEFILVQAEAGIPVRSRHVFRNGRAPPSAPGRGAAAPCKNLPKSPGFQPCCADPVPLRHGGDASRLCASASPWRNESADRNDLDHLPGPVVSPHEDDTPGTARPRGISRGVRRLGHRRKRLGACRRRLLQAGPPRSPGRWCHVH